MKWGKKKPSPSSAPSSSSSSSSHANLISHVFPLSWFSKSKPTNEKPTPNPKGKQNPQKLIPKSPISTTCSTLRDNKFYTQDNDGFWRLNFGNINDHEEPVKSPQDYCGNCKSSIKQLPVTKKRSHKTHDHPREIPSKQECAKDQGLERTYRRILEATSKLRGGFDEVRDIPSEKSDWEKLKEEKIREFRSKSEKQRKSFHISREYPRVMGSNSRGGKIRVNSPRTPNSKTETCKIQALENLKKKKMKKMKEIALLDDKAAAMESFAVVKCSRDPQQDFKDSMLEMIKEKRIRRPEELEELLACYLTLNADEYHDLIIKVFREVWRELEEPYFDQKLVQE